MIFGNKATQLITEQLYQNCANCASKNTLFMLVFQKYAHLYWIPLFPTTKTATTKCSNCEQVLEKKEFNYSLNESFNSIKSKLKSPIWTFIGTIAIELLKKS